MDIFFRAFLASPILRELSTVKQENKNTKVRLNVHSDKNRSERGINWVDCLKYSIYIRMNTAMIQTANRYEVSNLKVNEIFFSNFF
jgi:hypothetical protein